MGRLRRFLGHRFIGRRDSMEVYDLDVRIEFEQLAPGVDSESLVDRNQLQSFGPDTLAEARNRGFRALRVTEPKASQD